MIMEDVLLALKALQDLFDALPPERRLVKLREYGELVVFLAGVVELIEAGDSPAEG